MWFGQNKDITCHPKFTGIPIGIANIEWPHGNQAVFNAVLDTLEANPLSKREQVYINFSPSTNPQRQVVFNLLKDKSFSFIASNKSIGSYLQEMAHFRYVISPFGNGLDCHRTWEALYMGCIPVVTTSTLDSLYEDLPVIILKDWLEISLERLQEKSKHLSFNKEKIYMDYWINAIMSLKQ